MTRCHSRGRPAAHLVELPERPGGRGACACSADAIGCWRRCRANLPTRCSSACASTCCAPRSACAWSPRNSLRPVHSARAGTAYHPRSCHARPAPTSAADARVDTWKLARPSRRACRRSMPRPRAIRRADAQSRLVDGISFQRAATRARKSSRARSISAESTAHAALLAAGPVAMRARRSSVTIERRSVGTVVTRRLRSAAGALRCPRGRST